MSTEPAGEGGSSDALQDYLWFQHPEMARRVAEAEADIREGPLDMDVRIQVGPRPAWKEHADVTVQLVSAF